MVLLLYNTDSTVATVVVIPTAALFVFLAITTLLPVVYSSCCYHSPQARVASYVWRWSRPGILPLFLWFLLFPAVLIMLGIMAGPIIGYNSLSRHRQLAIDAHLHYLRKRYLSSQAALVLKARQLLEWWHHAVLLSDDMRSWNVFGWIGEEWAKTSEDTATFDGDMLSEAYVITLDSECLAAGRECMFYLADHPEVIKRYMMKIQETLEQQWELASLPANIKDQFSDLAENAIRMAVYGSSRDTPAYSDLLSSSVLQLRSLELKGRMLDNDTSTKGKHMDRWRPRYKRSLSRSCTTGDTAYPKCQPEV